MRSLLVASLLLYLIHCYLINACPGSVLKTLPSRLHQKVVFTEGKIPVLVSSHSFIVFSDTLLIFLSNIVCAQAHPVFKTILPSDSLHIYVINQLSSLLSTEASDPICWNASRVLPHFKGSHLPDSNLNYFFILVISI